MELFCYSTMRPRETGETRRSVITISGLYSKLLNLYVSGASFQSEPIGSVRRFIRFNMTVHMGKRIFEMFRCV
jgi:hypothetical protein